MSEMYYSKPNQTSKMKLRAKVVNASRDVFKTVISIQNVFRTKNGTFYKNNEHERPKAVNFFCKKLHLNIFLGPKNASGFTFYFHQKLHLRL